MFLNGVNSQHYPKKKGLLPVSFQSHIFLIHPFSRLSGFTDHFIYTAFLLTYSVSWLIKVLFVRETPHF